MPQFLSNASVAGLLAAHKEKSYTYAEKRFIAEKHNRQLRGAITYDFAQKTLAVHHAFAGPLVSPSKKLYNLTRYIDEIAYKLCKVPHINTDSTIPDYGVRDHMPIAGSVTKYTSKPSFESI